MNIEVKRAGRLGRYRSARLSLLAEPAGQLTPRGESQLGEDVLDVRVDRALGQEEPPGDLPVAEPVGDQAGDLELAPGERPCLAARRGAGDGERRAGGHGGYLAPRRRERVGQWQRGAVPQ